MGEDGAATCARVAAAAALLASVVVRAVVVATFLRTLDLGTSFLHADKLRPRTADRAGDCEYPWALLRAAPDHRDRTSELLAYGVLT
jgi:hypothetical protein